MASTKIIRTSRKQPDHYTEALRRLTKAVFVDAGERTKDSAIESIMDGAILGEGHIASKPGDAPNADTNELVQSGRVAFKSGDMRVTSVFDAPHAIPLEEGTRRMEPRPFHGPAFHRELAETRRNLRKAAKKAHQ